MHLKIDPKEISKYVLLPGDPVRVDVIGKKLKKFKIIKQNREFRIGCGYYQKMLVTVCSTGIGCPSTAIAVEELIQAGAKYLIRVGTCGGAWRKEIVLGSLIISTACVRDEGTTVEYVPLGFPAVADSGVVSALIESAKNKKYKYFSGINRTHDAFYGSRSVKNKWGNYLFEENWKGCDTPILSSDMESSALFIIASLRGVKAGAVLAVNANPESLKESFQNKGQKVVAETSDIQTKKVVEKAIKVSLDTLVVLSKQGEK